MKKAFTLIELLVVIAIIAILAAILFPVFAQAKMAAKKATSISDAKQWGLVSAIYTGDSDDRFPLWIYNGSFDVTTGDRDLFNVLKPYVKNRDLTKTAASPFSLQQRINDSSFPLPSSKTGSNVTDQEDYNLGWLIDYGINYQTMGGFSVDSAGNWLTNPQSTTSMGQPANTIEFITGIFNRSSSGALQDGGQLPIDPPCVVYPDGTNDIVGVPGGNGTYYFGGWQPTQPNAWNVFGGVWPYYNNYAPVTFMDGHTKAEQISQIAAGCDVKDSWGGYITNSDVYQWDNR